MNYAEEVLELKDEIEGLRSALLMKYVVLDEFGQVTAMTATRWTAERLIEGIKAHDSPTSRLGSWSIEPCLRPGNRE